MRRGQRMLDELARQGVIGSAELALAHRQLAGLRPPQAPRRPDALHVVLRYEALAARRPLASRSPFDPRVRASIDLDIQKAGHEARAALSRGLARRGRAAGRGHGRRARHRRGAGRSRLGRLPRPAHAGAIDFSRSPRSPGSTLKPFIYALALDRGVIRPSDVLADLPEGSSGINNADGHFLGPMLPRQALANSRNVPATNLLRMIGLDTTLPLSATPRPARFRCAGRQFRPFDGDRLAADDARTAGPRLWIDRRRRPARRSAWFDGQKRRDARTRHVGGRGAARHLVSRPIRWRGCRASRAMARPNIHFPSP